MTSFKTLEKYFEQNREAHLEELSDFLSIPSISSSTEHEPDMHRAAEWLVNSLQNAGLENVSIDETDGHPVVYGDWLHAKGKPTILIYGHYDVQPVDPIELWDSPPFEPEIRNNKIYARGASDDKGQVFMHIKAIEALLHHNKSLPVNVRILIEGEEEVGSPNLEKYLVQNHHKFTSDVVVISDTGMHGPGQPAICYGLRGLCGIQINIQSVEGDLHSGLYGGGVQNPIHALTKIISSFHNSEGRVQVDGFYDNVIPLSAKERKAFAELDFDEQALKEEIGATELVGETGYSYLEQTTARPTLEVNGIFGGFSGEGIKTVLPAKAGAKVTCRLVPGQNPDTIVEMLKDHVHKHLPAGVTVEIQEFDKGKAFITPLDHPAIQAAGESFENFYGVPTVYTRGGGSIPIVSDFDEIFEVPVVLMGFGLSTENFHAPNEHFHLENFDQGLLVICDYHYQISDFTRQALKK